MFHKILKTKPLEKSILIVTFEDETIKKYEVSQLFTKWNFLMPLSQNWFFKQVKVDAGGFGVSWNDDIAISCDELWENGTVFSDEQY
ncbi:MAG: DUF2442 domain-containing protein [Oscillospiraceae bacterium]